MAKVPNGVKHHCELRVPQKWMCSAMKPIFNILSKFIWTLIDTRRSDHERCDSYDRCISRQNITSASSFSINHSFSSTSKLLTPNMCCWSCKTLVTIYWPYLSSVYCISYVGFSDRSLYVLCFMLLYLCIVWCNEQWMNNWVFKNE